MNREAGERSESPRGRRPASQAALEWAALGVFLVTFGGYVGYELHSSRLAIETEQRSRMEHQAHIVEKMLGTRLQATSNALESLRADAPVLLSPRHGVSLMNERMEVMVASMTGVRTFLLVNKEGIAVASNRKELIGGDWHEGERYRAIRARPDASMVYVSPPFLTPLGNWALSLGRAILDPGGGFDGYVLAIIDPEYFNLLLDSMRYAPDMSAAMIHGDGKIIYRVPDPQGAVGMNLAEMPESGFDAHLRNGTSSTTWERVQQPAGGENLVVFQTIRPSTTASDEFLVASFNRDASAVFAPWKKELLNRVALLGVVALATIAGLSFHQRRRATLVRLRAEREAERRKQEEARVSLQAQLAHSARLAGMGTLVAGVAHEINNPLTSLMASAGTALEDVREFRESIRSGSDPDRDRLARRFDDLLEMLGDIGASAERISRIVKDLTILGRPEQRRERVRLADAVKASLKWLPEEAAHRVAIRTEIGQVPDVLASAAQLEQVLVNLVTNAALAIPEGRNGEVVVRIGPAGPGRVFIEVADDGAGIPPELQERVFEPFFTTRPLGKGTGLGLSICNAIVTSHGGTLRVKSQVGRGTTFRIELPEAAGEA